MNGKRMRRSIPEPDEQKETDARDQLSDTGIIRAQVQQELRRAIGANLQLSTRTGLGGIIAYLATIGLQTVLPAVEQYDAPAVLIIMWLITRANRPE